MKRTISILLTCLLVTASVTACQSDTPLPSLPDYTVEEEPAFEPPVLGIYDLMNQYNNELRSTVSYKRYDVYTSDEDYCSAARQLVDDLLRNPSSAVYNEITLLDKDTYGRAIIYVNVSSQNAYGGYVREQCYVCIKGFDYSGHFYYNQSTYYLKIDSGTNGEFVYNFFKSLNDFNEHPADAELGDRILKAESFSLTETVQLADGTGRDKYDLQQENIAYSIYLRTTDYCVDAIQIEFDVDKWFQGLIYATALNAFTEAFTGYDSAVTDQILYSVFDYENCAPTQTPDLYRDCFVFNCRLEDNILSYSIAFAEKEAYEKDAYWSPLHAQTTTEHPAPDSTPESTTTKAPTTASPVTTVKPETEKPETTTPPTTKDPVTTTTTVPKTEKPETTTKPVTPKPTTTTAKPITQKPSTTTTKPVTQKPSTTTTKPITQKPVTTTRPVTTPQTTTSPIITEPTVPEIKEPWVTEAVEGGVEIVGIGETVASGHYEIPSVIDGKQVVGIGYRAFYYDNTIQSITLPESLTYIGDQAFYGVNGLQEIIIPQNVHRIGNNSFMRCNNLANVYISAIDISIHTYAFSNASQRNCDLTIHAPSDSNITFFMCLNWDAELEEWNG